ncbi:MAG: DUF4860 domain-containing protein [Peptococcaceae bacterium]|nr:DUF4860 domain-containing protein [Peptococcaceae bacterium]
MRRESRSSGIVVGLLITLVFAAVMLFVLITGARFYQNIATVMEEQFKERTCLSYIVASVRSYDQAGSVSIVDFHGVDALLMQETIAELVVNKMIYFYDGHMYELYALAETPFELGDGFRLIQMDDLRFERLAPALFRVECGSGGRTADMVFYVSSGL